MVKLNKLLSPSIFKKHQGDIVIASIHSLCYLLLNKPNSSSDLLTQVGGARAHLLLAMTRGPGKEIMRTMGICNGVPSTTRF